jgi:hypothetical protein
VRTATTQGDTSCPSACVCVRVSVCARYLGGRPAHVRHHPPSHTGLKDVGGGKVEHLFQGHLHKSNQTRVNILECINQFFPQLCMVKATALTTIGPRLDYQCIKTYISI